MKNIIKFKISSLFGSVLVLFVIFLCQYSNGYNIAGPLTKNEIEIIERDSNKLMKIYTIDQPSDTAILRTISKPLSKQDLLSENYNLLCRRMIKTVSDSTVGGVGLAAPQIGINRRVVAVQRMDKTDFPFEVYPNIEIKAYAPETTSSLEGCLSVPNKIGAVERSIWVVISYTDTQTMEQKVDTIRGYTAIIFQHEVDHLEGIIYTDKLSKEK